MNDRVPESKVHIISIENFEIHEKIVEDILRQIKVVQQQKYKQTSNFTSF